MKKNTILFALLFAVFLSGSASALPDASYSISNLTSDGMRVTLTDLFDPITDIAKTLTGFQFTLSSTPTTISVANVTAAGIIIYNGSGGFNPGMGNSPYGWGITDTYLLAAGNGSYKPYEIVNNSILPNAMLDGLRNAQHNPYLVGPVSFDIKFNGLLEAPTVTPVAFYFGTGPAIKTVPEPATLLLLGGALVGIAVARKRI